MATNAVYAIGLLILSYCCWLAWMPLGYIVFGGMVCLPMLVWLMTPFAGIGCVWRAGRSC